MFIRLISCGFCGLLPVCGVSLLDGLSWCYPVSLSFFLSAAGLVLCFALASKMRIKMYVSKMVFVTKRSIRFISHVGVAGVLNCLAICHQSVHFGTAEALCGRDGMPFAPLHRHPACPFAHVLMMGTCKTTSVSEHRKMCEYVQRRQWITTTTNEDDGDYDNDDKAKKFWK